MSTNRAAHLILFEITNRPYSCSAITTQLRWSVTLNSEFPSAVGAVYDRPYYVESTRYGDHRSPLQQTSNSSEPSGQKRVIRKNHRNRPSQMSVCAHKERKHFVEAQPPRLLKELENRVNGINDFRTRDFRVPFIETRPPAAASGVKKAGNVHLTEFLW